MREGRVRALFRRFLGDGPVARLLGRAAVVLGASLAFCTPALADGYPPYWDNSTGAVHFNVLPWPTDAEFASRYYTHQGVLIRDSRLSSDGSNGGRAPQNYANVSSSCIALPDQDLPSVSWFYKDGYKSLTSPTLFFRWRVEQIPNTYATGPNTQPYSSVDPYFAAQWTVLIDIDGDGFREFAANIDGNSGTPSASVDVMKSIYSDTRTQSLDYYDTATGRGDPSIHYLFHQPTAFAYKTYGAGDPLLAYDDYLLNFRNAYDPTPVWPNGSAETIWDYGSTRVQNISTTGCNEFLVDYQIPLDMLDATAVGGPKITKDTPMCFTFVTANSNQDPLQKDVAFNTSYTFTPDGCIPCGDLVTLGGTVIPQPVIDQVTAVGCGPTTFTARIRDAITETCAATINTTTSAPTFYAYFDSNANGVADDAGSSWTDIGVGTPVAGNPGVFTLTASTASLNAGQYLVGVQAVDEDQNLLATPPVLYNHRTFSYLTAAEVAALVPADPNEMYYANPTPEPGPLTAVFSNTCGETASLAKSVSPAYTSAGGVVTFTLRVTNDTSAPFDVSSITDALPPGFSYQSTSPPSGAAPEGGSLEPVIASRPVDGDTGNVTWTFGGASVAAGASETLTFTAQVAAAAGTFTNSATAVTGDPDWGTLTSNIVDVGIGAPELTIAKRASVAKANPGETITYTLTYSNDSPVSATGVAVLDTLPAGLTFAGAAGGGAYFDTASTVLGTDGFTYTCIKNHIAAADNRPVTGASRATYWAQAGSGGAAWSSGTAYHEPRTIVWEVGNLASGEGPYTLTYQVVVDQGANTRTENTATIDSNETAPATATTAIYVPSPLQISKVANKPIVDPQNLTGPLAPYNQVIFTVNYQNTGTTDLSVATITDTTMPGFTYNSCTTLLGTCTPAEPAGDGYGNDDGTCDAGEPCTVTYDIGALTAGAGGSVTLTLTVTDPYNAAYPNPATNTATIDTLETGPFSDSASVAILEYDCGGAKSRYFFHDSDASSYPFPWTGAAPGTPLPTPLARNYATTASPASPTATDIVVTITDDSEIELAHFAMNPPLSRASGFSITGTVDMEAYMSKDAGGKVNILCYLYDYDPDTGEAIQIGTQAADSGAGLRDNFNLTFNVTPSGIVREGNLLMWRFTAQRNGSYTGDVGFHYDSSATTGTQAGLAFGDVCFAPLSVTMDKTVSPLQAAPGAALQYTIAFTNSGQRDVTGARLVDTLPAGVTFVGATLNGTAMTSSCPAPGLNQYCAVGQVITFDARTAGAAAGVLQGGGQGTLLVDVTIDSSLAAGITTLTNRARLETASTDPVEDEATTDVTLTPAPDVFLLKSADRTLLNPGDTVTYTVQVVNVGTGTASNIVVTDLVPSDTYFTYVAGSIAGGDTPDDSGAPTLAWTINTLAPGDAVSLTFQMLVASSGVPAGVTYKDNFASATEATPTSAASNTVRVAITTNPNLALTKAVSSPTSTASLGTGDGATTVFTATLFDTEVIPRSVKIYVAGAQAGADDGAGAVTGSNLTSATVNYATGALHLEFVAAPTAGQAISATFVKEVSPGVTVQYSVEVGTGDGVETVFDATLVDNPVLAGSAAVLVAGSTVGADSGTGQLVGDDLTASTIDYTSGAVRLEFLAPPASGEAVTVTYRKRLSPGKTVQYTMTVSNVGGSTATGVVVSDPIPAGATYVLGSMEYDSVAQTDAADGDNASFDGITGTVTFNPGDMAAPPPDSTHTLRFSVLLDGSYGDGVTTVVNTATAQAVNAASKSATASAEVLTAPLLTLSKSGPATVAYPVATVSARTGNYLQLSNSMYVEVGDYVYLPGIAAPTYRKVTAIDSASPPAPLPDGSPNILVDGAALAVTPAAVYPVIKYTLTYTNAGSASAPAARIKDILPTGLNYLAATPAPTTAPPVDSNGYLVWELGTLDPGASGQIVVITRPTGSGSPYSNTATMSSPEAPEFPSNTVVTSAGALLVAKSTSTPTVTNFPTAGVATYTITLTNQTAAAITGLQVEDILPNTFQYAGGAATVTPLGACTGGATPTVVPGASVQIYWTGCQVAASGATTIQFNASVGATVSAGTYQNPVAVTGPAGVNILPFDELLTTAEDVTVVITGDIKVSKVVASPPAACAEGTCVTYRVTAANVGTSNATGVVIADRDSAGSTWPPANLTYVSSSTSAGSFDTIAGNWTLDLLAGAVATLDITFSVDPFTATITNCASRTASVPADTNPANDMACADIVPTRVILSSFDAFAVGGRVVVEWATAVETDTAGFYLYRLDHRSNSYLPLDTKLLPAVIGSPQGGTYRFTDESARPGREYTYLLVEMEASGTAIPYGPFVVRPTARASADGGEGADARDDTSGTFTRQPRGLTVAKAARLEKARNVQADGKPTAGSARADSLKLYVDEDGLRYVSAARIADLMGLGEEGVRRMIGKGQFALSAAGTPVAYLPATGNDGFFFYGRRLESIFSNRNVYWLTRGQGVVMTDLAGEPPPAAGVSVVPATLHEEQDLVPLTSPMMKADQDYWFWGYVVGGYPSLASKEFSFTAQNPETSGGQATLTVHLQGFTATEASPEHHAVLRVNGVYVGEAQWDDATAFDAVVSFDPSLLRDGANTIAIEGVLDAGVPYSVFFIDSFDVAFAQRAETVGNSLLVRSGNQTTSVTVGGFDTDEILVLDLSNASRPRVNRAVTVRFDTHQYTATFLPSGAGAPSLVAAASAAREVMPVADRPSTLASRSNAADYLVVAPGLLGDAAAAFAEHRRGQGLDAMVVDIEDVFDEFAAGIATPAALKAFLAHTATAWRRAPRYVLLLGDGTFDYKDNLGFGENLVPALVVDTPLGLFPADGLFGDVDGDHRPDMAIGRIPVLTSAEAAAVLAKIKASEGKAGNVVVMLSDRADEGGDFPTESLEATSHIPAGYDVRTISLETYNVSQARAALLDIWRKGAAVVNFIGHGGVDVLSRQGLLTNADVPALQSAAGYPVVSAFTCMVGEFSFPGYDSLSEALLLGEGSGALAVWSPSGMSYSTLAKTLNAGYFEGLFNTKPATLGDAVLRGFEEYRAGGGPVFMMDVYNLLGDPATEVR